MISTFHVLARQAERLLGMVLLAASPNHDGLHDVMTGCAHALEPLIEEGGGRSTLQFFVGAPVLWAIEQEDEEAIALISWYTDDEVDILRAGGTEARRYSHRDGCWCWDRVNHSQD